MLLALRRRHLCHLAAHRFPNPHIMPPLLGRVSVMLVSLMLALGLVMALLKHSVSLLVIVIMVKHKLFVEALFLARYLTVVLVF